MEHFLAMVLLRPADTVGHLGTVTLNLFCARQILLCSELFVLNI